MSVNDKELNKFRGEGGATAVAVVNADGSSVGGGTQYTDGATSPANPVGGIPVFDNAGTITAVSDTNPLPVDATFSGTVESSPTFKDDPTNAGETPKYGKRNSSTYKQQVEADVSGTVTANLSATDNAVLDDIAANQTDASQKTQIVDGSGNVIGSTGNALNVNISSGSSSGTQYDDGDVRGTATGTLMMGDDGTNIQSVAVDSSGDLQVDIKSSTLPTGAATSANQTTIIGHLDGVEGLLTTIDTDTGNIDTSLNNIEAGYASEGSALGSGVLLQGDDGTDRKNISVDSTTGDVQVDVTNTVTVDGSGVTQPVSGTITANAGTGNFNVNLQDGSGTDITSTGGALDVNIASGLSSGTQYTEGDTDASITGTALMFESNTGTNAVSVVSNSTPLPISDAGGAITVDGTVTANLSAVDNAVLDQIELNQDSQTSLLTTIDSDTSNLPTIETNTNFGTVVGGGTETGALRVTIANNSTGVVSIDDNGGAITVDGTVTANLSATDNAVLDQIELNQDSQTAILTTIDSDTGAIKTAVETIDNAISGSEMQVDVVGALPTGTNTIGAVNVKPTTSGGLSIFRSIDLDESEEQVKSSAGQVFGWYIYNNSSAVTYVKFYNATAASVTVGTTTPVMTVPIPASAGANVEFTNGIEFDTAITVAATGAVGDSDTTAPATNDLIINVLYK